MSYTLNVNAEVAAQRLVSRAEQTSSGLLVKLRLRGFTDAEANAAIQELVENNLVNDARYAKMWVEARLRKRKADAPRSLLQKLISKNINSKLAQASLREVLETDDAEDDLLRRYVAQAGEPQTREMLRAAGFSALAIEKLEI